MGIIASSDDALWVNVSTQEEVDIDEIYNISAIQAIVFDNEENMFYILANKLHRRLGYFLIAVDAGRPQATSKPKFLIRWMNKLSVDNAALHIIKSERTDMKGNDVKTKEIVVSSKVSYTNKYIMFIIDHATGLTKFRFEHNHLWEHQVKGFLTSFNDFIILNDEGLSFIPLGTYEKRTIQALEGSERMVHSL